MTLMECRAYGHKWPEADARATTVCKPAVGVGTCPRCGTTKRLEWHADGSYKAVFTYAPPAES